MFVKDEDDDKFLSSRDMLLVGTCDGYGEMADWHVRLSLNNFKIENGTKAIRMNIWLFDSHTDYLLFILPPTTVIIEVTSNVI